MKQIPKTFKELFDNIGIEPTTDENGNTHYNFTATLKEKPKQDMKQTAVEWLVNELKNYDNDISYDVLNKLGEQAKQMEKQQISKSYIDGSYTGCGCYDYMTDKDAEQYYNETYGSSEHIVDINEMVDHIGDANKMVEISDEEIKKTAKEKHIGLSRDVANYRGCFEQGAKWYREQLKK